MIFPSKPKTAIAPRPGTQPVDPITEEDLAEFLVQNPEFFERQADLLAAVQLTSPHGGRAVSLQERQAGMLRDKIKILEQRIMEMMRHGNENMLISDKLLRWARQMFQVVDAVDLPDVMVHEIHSQFSVPQVALRVWDVADVYGGQPFARDVSDDMKILAESLTTPYCGINEGFDAVGWLEEPEQAASVALIALRDARPQAPTQGLLVLASPDPQRFEAGMATDFLERLAALGAAALTRLRHDPYAEVVAAEPEPATSVQAAAVPDTASHNASPIAPETTPGTVPDADNP